MKFDTTEQDANKDTRFDIMDNAGATSMSNYQWGIIQGLLTEEGRAWDTKQEEYDILTGYRDALIQRITDLELA